MGFVVSPNARSWVKVAADSDFPIQNLPFGMADCGDDDQTLVTRIGDFAVDVLGLVDEGLINCEALEEFDGLAEIGKETLIELRRSLYDLLREGNPKLRDNSKLKKSVMLPANELRMLLPMEIPSFVDFYSGIHHASNVGKMFRPDKPPLLPNYRHMPVAYNGRASSIVPSHIPIIRPKGQIKPSETESPIFGPTRELDFELELGFFLIEGNEFGERVPVATAEELIAGLVLVNDWSARDLQRWEYQPLGPFLAKSFATSVSPWMVTMDALEPFRISGPKQDPEPLPYLKAPKLSHFDIQLEVLLRTENMKEPQVVSRTNSRELYWSFAQQLAHQTSNGTPAEPGDLYATGTISGTEPDSFGSLLELSWRGSKPIKLRETGEERFYLEDGDEVTLRGYCLGKGFRIGFGELINEVMPAV